MQSDGNRGRNGRPLDEQIRAIDCRELLVVIGHAAADVRKLLRAPDTPEVHERVVRLALTLQPAVPIVTPIARILELKRQSLAARLLGATPVAVVTIEIAHRETGELCRATAAEGSLTCPGDHDVEAVIAGDVVADVRHLDDHTLVDQVRVGAAPAAPTVVGLVNLGCEAQLVALAAIAITRQAGFSVLVSGGGSKTHAQSRAHHERLVVGARGRGAAVADGRDVAVGQDVAVQVAALHTSVDGTLSWPRAAGLAAVPIAGGVSSLDP
mmetsp:Transcript_16818/g.42327  ORF Transcript_16818/g.42327 Transcript_16818/m.42327 type:complete len:268 (+) Transcript_16818:311-1114(+)